METSGPTVTATILTHARKIFLREKIFPFAIRASRKVKARKPVKIRASCYALALEKVLALYPKRFVKLKNSNMDLITAKVEAAALSKKERKNVYICVDDEGECVLLDSPKGEVMGTYSNGSEVKEKEPMVADSPAPTKTKRKVTKVSAEEMKVIKENKDELRTVKKEVPKKSSKQKNKVMAATKKAAKKKTSTNRPSVKGEKTVPRGNNMLLTPAEWKKVDAILEKEGVSFSAWSRGLVQAKLK